MKLNTTHFSTLIGKLIFSQEMINCIVQKHSVPERVFKDYIGFSLVYSKKPYEVTNPHLQYECIKFNQKIIPKDI